MSELSEANRKERIALLRREGWYSGVWFADHLLWAADEIEAAMRSKDHSIAPTYADFQQRRGMLPDLLCALAPISDTVAGFDDKPGDTKLYFTLDELREMADAIDTITAIGSQSNGHSA